jgi:3-(3-hydroxy-phenyl)propionate hydroxylase
VPGAAAADAPITRADGHDGWLLRELGDGFTALVFGDDTSLHGLPLKVINIGPCGDKPTPGHLVDRDGVIAERYDLLPGSVVLLRPDQHVCARWRQPSAEAVSHAMRRALALH